MESSNANLPASSADLRHIGSELESYEELDRLAEAIRGVVTRALGDGPVRDALQGRWLGHPAHPMLTDLPIGFWTSAFVLDLVGGRRSQRAADLMVAAGVVTALPTAASGWADWTDLSTPKRRVGVVHALANGTAIGLYMLSWAARRKDRRFRGVVLGLMGATAATAGGYLGGHLVFGEDDATRDDIDQPDHGRLIDLAADPGLSHARL